MKEIEYKLRTKINGWFASIKENNRRVILIN